MMGRWLGWAGKTVATALLLSFLSIWTTGYIVNSYMETLLKQLNVPLQMQPFALSGTWGKLWGASPISQDQEAARNVEERSGSSSRVTDETGSKRSGDDMAASNGVDKAPDEAGDGKAPSGDSWREANGRDTDTFAADESIPTFGGSAVPEMTAAQRQVLQSVMAKLNGEQLTQLARYLEEGMTEVELAAVGELVAPSLTETEYIQLMELLNFKLNNP